MDSTDGTDVATVERSVINFKNYGKSNKESLAELFVSLLLKLSSIEKLCAKGLCASTYQGSWISKEWDSKVAVMSVDDFTDRSQNVARAVEKSQLEDIYKCIQQSIRLVSTFMYGYAGGARLRDSLFGTLEVIVPHPPVAVNPLKAQLLYQFSKIRLLTPFRVWEKEVNQCMAGTHSLDPMDQISSFEHNLSKKIRVNEGWGGTSGVPILFSSFFWKNY